MGKHDELTRLRKRSKLRDRCSVDATAISHVDKQSVFRERDQFGNIKADSMFLTVVSYITLEDYVVSGAIKTTFSSC